MKLKKIFLLAAVALTGIATSCQYDDGEIWENVNNLADRVTSLEAVTKQMNSDIAAMQSIVSAVEKKILVSEVEQVADGCIIHFTDGTQAVIKNGKNGQNGTNGTNGKDGQDGTDGKDGQNGSDGKDGVNGQDGKDGKDGKDAPVINVAKDNGVYYWTITIDGKTEWLTDEEGNKFPVSAQNGANGQDGKDGQNGTDGKDGQNGTNGANGADGVAPVVTIGNNGNWFINGVDTGKKAVGEKGADGDSAFRTVEEQNGMLVITMNDNDNTVYTLPMAAAAEEKFVIYKDTEQKEISADNVCLESTGTVLNYVTLLQNASVEVISVPAGLSILVDEENKQLEITGTLSGNNKAVLLFYNGNQTITSVLTFDTSALASVNKELMLAQANNQNEDTITIQSIPAGENNIIKLPAAGDGTSRTFKIASVDATSELVIKDLSGSGEYQGEVIIDLGDNTTAISQIDVQLPGATVKFIGKAGEVIASTKPNTFIVGEGSITTLTIVKGNVEIEAGATVGSIVRHADNKDEATYVINKGALTTAPTDKILVYGSVVEMNLHLGIAQGSVTLTEDVVLTKPLVIAKGMKVTLDLGGKNLSYTSVSAATSFLIKVENNAELNLTNGTIEFLATNPDTNWGDESQNKYPGYANNTIANSGKLIIENATLYNKTPRGGASYVIDNYNGSHLIINEGSSIQQSNGDIAIRMFNSTASGEINVEINGGEIVGRRAVWIQLAGSDFNVAPVMNLKVSGGTLTSTDDVYGMAIYSYTFGNSLKKTRIDIEGGVINGDVAITGASNAESLTELETLNISGGVFNANYDFGVYSYGSDEYAKSAIQITGGTYVENPSYYVIEGFEVKENENFWTVVESVTNPETGSDEEEESEIETEG